MCFDPKFNTHFMLTFICCFDIYISYFHFQQSMHALEMLDFFLSKFVMNTNTLKVYKIEAINFSKLNVFRKYSTERT